MPRIRVSVCSFALTTLLGSTIAVAQAPSGHGIVPLRTMVGQSMEKVWGNLDTPGAAFVMRIHNDAGFVVLPHIHPMDENVVVVQGRWSVGMGRHLDRAALEPMELGTFGFVPKHMPHFAWSRTETIIQVHGIAPFASDLADPVYELTDTGILLKTSLLRPGQPTQTSPPDCFALRIGTSVRGEAGIGDVVGALCSPANAFTQYRVRRTNGAYFWATREELTVAEPED